MKKQFTVNPHIDPRDFSVDDSAYNPRMFACNLM